MKIINETELMSNQKASTTVLPDVAFEALQTSAGTSLLFSISSENIFYCTYEVPGDTHGWQRTNLSDTISKNDFGGASITVKGFDLGQDLNAGTIDLVLAITAKDTDGIVKDWLYVSLANPDANWGNYIPAWQQVKFDDPNNTAYALCQINDVFVANFGSNQFIFADVVSNPTAQTLSRYAIDPTGGVMLNVTGTAQCWIPHATPMTLQAGHISSVVGCGPEDESVNGIYTLFSSDGIPQLVYAPLFNPNDPGGAPFPTDFVLPDGSDNNHMAMDVSKPSAASPDTDLFFASNGALYFAPNASQINVNGVNPSLKQIYTHDLFNNIQSITVKNWESNIVLWGQSIDPDDMQTSRLFVMECAAGHETNADAWSAPIPVLVNVKNSTSYVHDKYSAINKIDADNGNAYGSCTVMFAHQQDGSLVQLFQDPITTAWQERYLLTEPLDATTVLYETVSYTSHIRITDDNNMAQPFIPVSIWASSPCNVYVNDVYNTLQFTEPLQATTDESGIVNIMQPVDSIGGICYNVAVQDPSNEQWYTQVVNPLAVTAQNIAQQVPDDKTNHLGVNVTDEMGDSTALINSTNYNGDQQLATSQNIYSYGQHYSQLNSDGLTDGQTWPLPGVSSATALETVQHVKKAKPIARPDRQAKHIRFNPATSKIWGTTFGKNAKHYKGIEAMKEMGVALQADGSIAFVHSDPSVGGFLGNIEAKAGHLFKWMKSEAHKLESLAITLVEDGLDCLVKIAGSVYHFVVKCMNDIANAIHTALNAIEAAFKDLVKWIGTLFAWNDFIQTHSVIKNLFVAYGNHCIDHVQDAIDGITGLTANVVSAIDKWAGFPEDSTTSTSKNNNQDGGQHSPQSNWGHQQTKNNAGNAAFDMPAGEFTAVVNTLMSIVSAEGEILANTLQKLESIDMKTISMADLMKKLVDIIADDVLQSMETILTSFLNLVGDIVKGMMDSLQNETLNIPVISKLYQRYVGSPLTILDLICLVNAIPITVMYKLAHNGTAPFSKGDPDTIALATAADYTAIAQLCASQNLQTAAASVSDDPDPGTNGWFQPDLHNRWYRLFFAGNVMALVGGTAIAAFGYLKTKNPSSKTYATLYAVSYMPYIGPDIVGNIPGMVEKESRWYSILNAGLAAFGVLKAFWDIRYVSSPADPAAPVTPGWFGNKLGLTGYDFLSPWIDAVLNAAWELPVVEAFTHSDKNTNDIIDLVANTCFNATGVMSPLVTFKVPPSPLFWAGVQTVLNVCYGVGSVAESLDGQPIDPINFN